MTNTMNTSYDDVDPARLLVSPVWHHVLQCGAALLPLATP